MRINRWVKTGVIAAIGGGIAGMFDAAMDPAKYQVPQDIGSGKLVRHFLIGAALTLIGVLFRSPIEHHENNEKK